MDFRLLNAIRDIQVASKECDLYSGDIDGKWGKGSAGGATALLNDFNNRSGIKATLSTLSITDASVALMGIQSSLKALKLYTGEVDGKMGPGTWGGFLTIVNSYKVYQKVPLLELAWSKRVGKEFLDMVKTWTKKKGYWEGSASALMSCMNFESGNTFRPDKQNNGGSNYFGLIQFGDAAATDLGVPLTTIVKMGQLQQLELVFKYFEMWERRGKRFGQLEDFYLTIFYPAAVGKKPDEVIFRRDSEVRSERLGYAQNDGFDANDSGVITVGQIAARLRSDYYEGMLPKNRVVAATLS